MVADCFAGGLPELHVLAVDDSVLDRKVIERLLKVSCCKVTVVESGRRALQYLGLDGEKSPSGFDELKVNLIMTDYSMPGMTGFELLQKIKGSSKLREIPVVIMSSENILARVDRCLEEGAERFLVKPVKLSDVQKLKDCILNSYEKKNLREVTYNRKFIDDSCLPHLPPPMTLPPSPDCRPMKHLDVQRLKDCILNSVDEKNGRKVTCNRKFIDDSCLPHLPPLPPSLDCKLVKLSDVQRLKDCTLNSVEEKNGRKVTCNMKFIDDSCLPHLPSPMMQSLDCKTLKLSDVHKLKDCILDSAEEKNEKEVTQKGKVMDDSCLPHLPPPAIPPPLSPMSEPLAKPPCLNSDQL